MSETNSPDEETVTINGIELEEGVELVLTEDDRQLGDMIVTENVEPEENDPPKAAPLGAGTTLTVEEWARCPDGLNVTFATPFGSLTLNEVGIEGYLQTGRFRPGEEGNNAGVRHNEQ